MRDCKKKTRVRKKEDSGEGKRRLGLKCFFVFFACQLEGGGGGGESLRRRVGAGTKVATVELSILQ